MRLAANDQQTHGAGAEVIAVSIDEEVRQAAMFARWPTPHVLYVSDPDGRHLLDPLGLYDPNERDGMGLPAMVVIGPDGTEEYRYVGRDFADRTTDADVYAAVAALGLPAMEPPAGGPIGSVPADLGRFFKVENLVPYFKGNRFGAHAIAGRVDDPIAKATALQHRDMADATLAAWEQLTGS